MKDMHRFLFWWLQSSDHWNKNLCSPF